LAKRRRAISAGDLRERQPAVIGVAETIFNCGQALAMALEKANWTCSSMPRLPVAMETSTRARRRIS